MINVPNINVFGFLLYNDFAPFLLIVGVIFGAVCYSQKDAVRELLKIQSNI